MSAAVPPWRMQGELVGACNCDWGCPCNLEAPPTQGFCDGFYTIVVREGDFGGTTLDGIRFVMGGHAPGPIHEGDGSAILILDEAMTTEQRSAVERLWRGGGVGSPFDEFASVTTVWHEPMTAPIDVHLDGIRSRVQVGGDDIYELALARVRNPVTMEEEMVHPEHPTGFTSKQTELGMSTVARFRTDVGSYEHSGKYAEYAKISTRGREHER